MTIRKGVNWGEPVERPAGAVVANDDAELASLATASEPIELVGGDVHRSLGAPRSRAPMQRLPMDLLEVATDQGRHVAAAHVVCRHSWWRGEIVAVMNVGQLGDWIVAPRAHPNDGRFDVVEVAATMPFSDRLRARRRLRQGTHVPHPDITVAAATERGWRFDRTMQLWIDGVRRGSCTRIDVLIRPDAYHLHA